MIRKYSTELFWGLLTAIFSLVPFFLIQKGGGPVPIDLPLFPIHGDFHLVANLFEGVSRGEVIPYIKNDLPRMGAPFAPLNLSVGFPLTEQFQLAVVKIFSFFTENSTETWNLYFLAGYLFSSLAFFLSAVLLGIMPAVAFGLSFAFTYLPMHFMRYEHIFISQYWVLAPSAAIILSILKKERPVPRRTLFLLAGSVFFVTLWHSYFGFFYSGVLCMALVFDFIRKRRKQFVSLFLASILPFVIGIVLSTAHHTFAYRESKDPPPPFKRYPSETLFYSLRPWAMLLPIDGHRFQPFKKMRDYGKTQESGIEGLTESIGTLGLIGFILGLVSLVRRKKFESGLVAVLGTFFSFRIGIASLVAYTVYPVFRSTNRISPMIAAAALFGLGLALKPLIEKYWFPRHRKWSVPLIGFILALFSVWDQVIPAESAVTSQNEEYNARKFIHEIEERVGSGAVLQLPVATFPEHGPVYYMVDYAHSVAPRYSKNTRWSYGTWRGTQAMNQIYGAAADPAHFKNLKAMGFSGVWIDRYGYPDRGDALISEISRRTNSPFISSGDGRRVFFFVP